MKQKSLPNHIAIIPDGNRRWAKEHGLPTFEGHRKGADVAVKIAKKVRQLGVHTLTFWALSTENFSSRDNSELNFLMKLFDKFLTSNASKVLGEETKFVHIGRKDRLSKSLLEKIANLEQKTKHLKKNVLNLALDYGGRDEVIRAIKKVQSQKLKVKNLNEENFNQFLDTANQPYPNPDLIIRTSGEMRTSGLMIWQAAYAEYIFFDKHFPDLTEQDIDWAVEEYEKRQRRFGK